MSQPFYIGEESFRVFLPDVSFEEEVTKSGEDAYNSRKLTGIMTTERRDRQGETVLAKGLDFSEFLSHGHFNDNHSQETSAIVGYPERVQFHRDLSQFNSRLKGVSGWTCEGYVLKGTKRSDAIWELAKALMGVPNRRLGFSIEGKVIRRNDKTIEEAKIRNVAITNCPVNTDCSWDVLSKSFADADMAQKALAAGFGASPGATNGAILSPESLETKVKKTTFDEDEKKKKRLAAMVKALQFDDLMKAMELVLEKRPDFDDEAAAYLVTYLFKKGDGK